MGRGGYSLVQRKEIVEALLPQFGNTQPAHLASKGMKGDLGGLMELLGGVEKKQQTN